MTTQSSNLILYGIKFWIFFKEFKYKNTKLVNIPNLIFIPWFETLGIIDILWGFLSFNLKANFFLKKLWVTDTSRTNGPFLPDEHSRTSLLTAVPLVRCVYTIVVAVADKAAVHTPAVPAPELPHPTPNTGCHNTKLLLAGQTER